MHRQIMFCIQVTLCVCVALAAFTRSAYPQEQNSASKLFFRDMQNTKGSKQFLLRVVKGIKIYCKELDEKYSALKSLGMNCKNQQIKALREFLLSKTSLFKTAVASRNTHRLNAIVRCINAFSALSSNKETPGYLIDWKMVVLCSKHPIRNMTR